MLALIFNFKYETTDMIETANIVAYIDPQYPYKGTKIRLNITQTIAEIVLSQATNFLSFAAINKVHRWTFNPVIITATTIAGTSLYPSKKLTEVASLNISRLKTDIAKPPHITKIENILYSFAFNSSKSTS